MINLLPVVAQRTKTLTYFSIYIHTSAAASNFLSLWWERKRGPIITRVFIANLLEIMSCYTKCMWSVRFAVDHPNTISEINKNKKALRETKKLFFNE